MTRVCGVIAAVLCACCLAGCASPRAGETAGAAGRAHAFQAERLVIHPLTRVVRAADGRIRIEAHFELLDRYGIGVRELGRLEFEARTGSSEVPGSVWRKDLRTGEANTAQFDRITGMYGATLEDQPEGLLASGRIALTIRFTALDGRVLAATWREGR